MSANVDRATLDFLNKFSEDERNEGQRLHKEGAVSQIFGTHLIIQGKVEDSNWSCRTKIQLNGNEWVGTADDKSESGKAALYATMLEKIERKGEIPETPNQVGEKTLTELLEEKLGRMLNGEEDEYLNKLERRFRRFEICREIFDSDIVRLQPRWPINGFDPLVLWPVAPNNILEFWNYLSHAFRKGNFDYPPYMDLITDREWTESKMREWERDREISEWKYQVEVYNKRPNEEPVEQVEFRLRLTNREARLMYKSERDAAFNKVDDEEVFDRLKERYAAGGLRMDAGSEILWSKFLRAASKEGAEDGGLRLDNIQNCRLLNRLFHQPEIQGRIVNLDEIPYSFIRAPLSWECRPSVNDEENYLLHLITSEGIEVYHTMRLLPALNFGTRTKLSLIRVMISRSGLLRMKTELPSCIVSGSSCLIRSKSG